MSDQKHDKKVAKTQDVAEPAVGEGGRSLSNWAKLADARRDLSGSDKARASLQSDPQAFLSNYGINMQAFAQTGGQAGLSSLERQLAFSAVQRDTLGVHRGCELVVGPVALACAGVVAGVAAAVGAAVAAAVAAVVANTAEAVNAVHALNVAWNQVYVHGAGQS